MISLQAQHMLRNRSEFTLHQYCCVVPQVLHFTQTMLSEDLLEIWKYLLRLVERDKLIAAADAMVAMGGARRPSPLVAEAKSLVAKACVLMNTYILRWPHRFVGLYNEMLLALGARRLELFQSVIGFLHSQVEKVMIALDTRMNDDYLRRALGLAAPKPEVASDTNKKKYQ